MASTNLINQFKDALKKYFPSGIAWRAESGSNLKNLIDSFSIEFCRIQERFNQFLIEIDPRKTTELLTEWEDFLALPDECSSDGATIEERRNLIVQRLTNQGGSSFNYFESIAENLGINVEVNDFLPFRAGQARAGDALTNAEWRFWFGATAPSDLSTPFFAGVGRAGDRLLTLGNKTLECTFAKEKPAHTNVIFFFTG